ncbi:MAG: DUF551 domain-containing protein [Bacteroidaceae bacterium]|nr:DUF551 domain-containing protein [Bacteroidaceae bacterium]
MKKQIEEMATVLQNAINVKKGYISMRGLAEALYNAGYRKQEWISVEEMLPEDSMTVITFNMSGEVDADYYAAYSLGFTDKTVTHWMPLPEPPKKGGAE